MKRSVIIFAIMLSSTVVFSQSTLKGPKAKNASPAERVAHASPLQFYTVPAAVQGPQAKNQKVWEKSAAETKIIYIRRDEQQLKGPKAKNKKVWKD